MKKRTAVSTVLAAGMLLTLTACGGASTTTAATAAETTVEAKAETTAAETTAAAEAKDTDSKTTDAADSDATGTVMLAAAASLEKSFTDKLIPMFNEKYPNIEVTGTYDSSGKLQTQIEEGADVDVFFSAAMKQMNALNDEGLMDTDSIVKLLENKIVLIVPKGSEAGFEKFEDIVKAEQIAVGDPESVPAGQYAKESLTNLKLWEETVAKSSLGTNVTEVLNWVSEGSANAGIVYATDAAKLPDKVTVIAAAPADSVTAVIYPVGITKESKNAEAAKAFVDFLQTDDAKKVFTDNGFSIAE